MNKLFNFIKKICYIFLSPLYWVSYFVPKSKNIWLFGAWGGFGRGDNPEAFFNYVTQYHPEVKAVWLTRSKNVYDHFKRRKCTIYYTNSIKAFFVSLRAKIGIINCYKFDLNRFCLNRTKLIQLWHGTPIKKIENDSILFIKQQNQLLNKIKTLIFPFSKEKYHYIIASSHEAALRFSTAFQIPYKNILITGYPRNDILLSHEKQKLPFLEKIKLNYKYRYLLLYAPTFRDSNKESLQLFESFDIRQMKDFLISKKAVLVIKGHILTDKSFKQLNFNCSQIHISNHKDISDVNSFLTNVDILITDYSSIFFDFLLLDRPIVFFPFDLQTYLSKDREMYYDYYEVTPGPKAQNWGEVIEYLNMFMQNPQLYAKERANIRKQFNQYCDDKSSERLFNEILSIINR